VLQFKVAIVGAGPAGYFAAQALQNSADCRRSFHIDMIERLPTPWGLVRSGVAPDHQKIKTVSKVFEKIAADENFRLFANVEVGSDLTVAQLQEQYDAVILATGTSLGKNSGFLEKSCVDLSLPQFSYRGTTRILILLTSIRPWIPTPRL